MRLILIGLILAVAVSGCVSSGGMEPTSEPADSDRPTELIVYNMTGGFQVEAKCFDSDVLHVFNYTDVFERGDEKHVIRDPERVIVIPELWAEGFIDDDENVKAMRGGYQEMFECGIAWWKPTIERLRYFDGVLVEQSPFKSSASDCRFLLEIREHNTDLDPTWHSFLCNSVENPIDFAIALQQEMLDDGRSA